MINELISQSEYVKMSMENLKNNGEKLSKDAENIIQNYIKLLIKWKQ